MILIENDLLADALNALPQDNRDILLMYWFLEMADREIAERMNLARRPCLLYTSYACQHEQRGKAHQHRHISPYL